MGWRFLAVVIILSAAVLFLLLYFSGFIFPESVTNGQQQKADNDKDSDFFMATTFGASSIGERHSYLVPGASFEYTFTKLGEFGYHGQP